MREYGHGLFPSICSCQARCRQAMGLEAYNALRKLKQQAIKAGALMEDRLD
jgi:hypothetical protein